MLNFDLAMLFVSFLSKSRFWAAEFMFALARDNELGRNVLYRFGLREAVCWVSTRGVFIESDVMLLRELSK